MSKIKVGIINVTGYAGVELARLLSQHPEVALTSVTGRSAAGKKLGEVFPHLTSLDLMIQTELSEVDLAFSAMPHQQSAKEIIPLLNQGIKVVDISADFRLKDTAEYPRWYNFTHPAPVASARLVANPGCYPTGAILALAPAVKAGVIKSEIIVDSKSGVSGAGRSLSLKTHYSEANEDTTAYALAGHRHLPEIVQELGKLSQDGAPAITFVPHLLPMTRGILTTCYAPLASGTLSLNQEGEEKLKQLYQDFYMGEFFVKVVESPPHTKHTWGSNFCLVHPTIDTRTGRLIVVSCIDNLVKGAAGQAIQNMNLMLGLPETTGLESPATYP